MKYVLWVLGWLWMLPCTLIGLPIVFGGKVKFHRFHADRYWAIQFLAAEGGLALAFMKNGNFGGYTIGPFIVSRDAYNGDDAKHVRHECRHVWQQLVLGIFHWIFYGLNYLWNRAKGMNHWDAYLALLLEVDARAAETGP